MRGVAVVLVLGLVVYSAVSFRTAKQPGSSKLEKPAQVSLDLDEVGASESVAELNTSTTGVTVNLMVTWTNDFECHVSGKDKGCQLTPTSEDKALKKIDDSIRNAQTAFSNSKIGATIKIVYKQRLNWVETGVINDMNLMNRCAIEGFCDIRSRTGAHIAAAFTGNGGLTGAARKGPNPRYRSLVIGKQVPLWTLAHEIGHIFGNRENRANEQAKGSCTSSETYFGYRTPDFKYQDLMSLVCIVGKYDCQVGKKITQRCRLMPHYGDPDIEFEGRSTGSAKECAACQMRKALPIIVNKMPIKR